MHLFGTHFGTYAVTQTGNGPQLGPFPHDPDPSPVGMAYLDLADHPQRVVQPMVRLGWLAQRHDPQGRGRKRGRDGFVPVDWATAARLVADEIRRVRDRHSNEAIFGGSYGWASAGRLHHAQGQLKRFLNLCGGFVASRHTYSYGAATVLLPHVIGAKAEAEENAPSWDLIGAHARVIISFGGFRLTNAQVGAGGVGVHRSKAWLERILAGGTRIIVISPVAADIPAVAGAERIEYLALRPNTDTAVMLAMAHEAIRLGWVKTAFLDRYTVGYEIFAAYVEGRTDGMPKTPEWAEAVSGLAAGEIRKLARLLAESPALLNATWSLQRARFGEQPYWALIALAAMAGQIGLPGRGFAFGLTAMSSIGEPVRHLRGPAVPQGRNPVRSFIPVARITELLERPGGTLAFDGMALTLPDIRLVFWAGGNPFHHHQDLNRLAAAWRRPDTVVVSDPMWTATARHADIVLPASFPFERNDIVAASRDRWIVASRTVRPPPPMVMNDREIFARIAREMELESAFTENADEAAWLRRIYAGYRANYPELPPFESFWDAGYAVLDPQAEAARPSIPFADFIADPEGAPLDTPSGRIEIFSQTIAGYGYRDMPGHPAWIPPEEYLGAPAARRYRLHLLSPQPSQRLHSQLAWASISMAAKHAGYERALLHPDDAAERGIREGDRIELYNDRGRCVVSAALSAQISRGVAVLPTGGAYDPSWPGAGAVIDIGGNPNVLTSNLPTSSLSQAAAPNSCLVEARRLEL